MNGKDLASRLMADLRAGVLVLNDRGVKVTPEQADERARNLCMGLLGAYEIREKRIKPTDHTGKRFAHMRVLAYAVGSPPRWLCRCDCGAEKIVRSGDLVSGKTRACGNCSLTTQMSVAAKGSHGEGGRDQTPEYVAWSAMFQRCTDPNFRYFANYGGRGIKVCERWERYEDFLEDMGRKPSPGHSLDRIDTNGNYESSNCRWATRKQQNRNTRRTAWVTYQGETMSRAEACERAGVSRWKGVREFDRASPPDWNDIRISRPPGVVPWHGWSCRCDTCADAKQKDKGGQS